MIEAKRGWANTISTKQDYKEITDGLGQRYEAALNTYKPVRRIRFMEPMTAVIVASRRNC
jgi:hypothetical protein